MAANPRQLSYPSVVEQYRALLAVSEAIISNRDLRELFRDLAHKLSSVISFDYASVLLHDAERDVMRLHLWQTPDEDLLRPGWEGPVEGTAAGWVWQTQQPAIAHDIEREERFPLTAEVMREQGIKSYYVFPLTPAGWRLGVMGFGCKDAFGCSDESLEFVRQVVKQVAVAVGNALNFEGAEAARRELAAERDRLRLLLEVNNAVVTHLDLHELFAALSAALRAVFHHQYISLSLYDPQSEQLRVHVLDFAEGKGLVREGIAVRVEDAPSGLALRERRPVPLTSRDIARRFDSEYSRRLLREGIKSGCGFPLVAHGRPLGTLVMASLTEETFPQADVELIGHIADQIAIAVENALQFGELSELKNKLAAEKLYLEEEIRTEHNFAEIIGRSPALRHVLREVETVAPTDSVVLIQGETGTGKELIARAIHDLSARRERTLVKVNCAAIPTGLLESELFGHERGAFTGAVAQRVGRFEVAHKGTLLLDEVGDIPLELQPKLLRVLQEGEFERLGSSRTTRVDVRVVAATNRDLRQMVAEGSFRADLYYRLNVFPVRLPPLRARAGDVPLLVSYFVQKHARRMNKRIETIPAAAMEALTGHAWAGNIRELENFIERAVILTRGSELRAPLAELQSETAPAAAASELVSLEENERRHIEAVLRHTKGVVGGKGGAAEILRLPMSTLRSRMKKLGLI
ncbi:MAG TPA: sigma 54-interacting transcriptional regulator [Pyrinomonadaceae bacterium]|jgi:formate hydrogenlyase transcriptional activator